MRVSAQRTSDHRLVLFDGTQLHDLDPETVKLVHAPDTVTVITKSDLMESGWIPPAELPDPILVSSETGEGIEKLVEQLRLNVEHRHGIYSAFAYSGSTSCGVARLFVGLIRV